MTFAGEIDGVLMLALSEREDGSGRSLIIQRGLQPDAQDRRLGLDTYSVSTESGATEYDALSGGANNGRTCGVIGEVNATHDSCINNNTICRAIRHTWEMKFDSVSGDSGGPVFAGVLDPDYGQGYGIHVHSTDGAGAISWYSPLGWVQAEFFNHFADHPSYRFCLNTSCSVRGP
jgi:hypothetical protein